MLFVLASHCGIPMWNSGQTGVVMFFTLSGFLITTLLLEERERTGGFSLKRFYARRARRLLPAMLAAVTLAVLCELVVFGAIHDGPLIIGSLTYTANFVSMSGLPAETGLGGMWSLALEEQFYLTWPLLLILTARVPRRWMIGGLVLACAA